MSSPERTQVVVIGSGFGGSFAASRLVSAGVDAVLLERGPWRDTLPTRSMGIADRAPLPQGRALLTHLLRSVRLPILGMRDLRVNKRGFFEAFFGNGLWSFATSNVGGGSHAFAGLLCRPSVEGFWDGHHPGVSEDVMRPHYEDALMRLDPVDLSSAYAQIGPEHQIGPGQPLTEALDQRRPGAFLIPAEGSEPAIVTDAHGVQRKQCEWDSNSFLGSASGAKCTLDAAVLWPAIRQGLDLRPLCEVSEIRSLSSAAPADGGGASAARYRVSYEDLATGTARAIDATHVVLAAGGINSTRLLMHSRDQRKALHGMPRLGYGIGGNADFLGFWKENAGRDLSRGLPVGRFFRPRDTVHPDSCLTRAGLQGVDRFPLPGFVRRWLRRQSILIAMGSDEANGRSFMKNGRYHTRYEVARNPGIQLMREWVKEVECATSTKVYAPPTPLTVHPLGGACLGATEEHGVVDGRGEVFGHPGLYVADSSVFPKAPGGPPSLAIAAWGSHVAEQLVRSVKGRSSADHQARTSTITTTSQGTVT